MLDDQAAPTKPEHQLLSRFRREFESLIAHANEGDFQSTVNLLAGFCSLVERGERIQDALVRWIGEFLHAACRGERLRQARRNLDLQQKIEGIRSAIGGEEAFRDLAGGENPGVSRLRQIYRKQTAPTDLAEFLNAALGKGTPSPQGLSAARLAAQRVRCQLLRGDQKGKERRSELQVRRWGTWNSQSEFHAEIVDEVNSRLREKPMPRAAAVYRQVAERLSLLPDMVKKIVQRTASKKN